MGSGVGFHAADRPEAALRNVVDSLINFFVGCASSQLDNSSNFFGGEAALAADLITADRLCTIF